MLQHCGIGAWTQFCLIPLKKYTLLKTTLEGSEEVGPQGLSEAWARVDFEDDFPNSRELTWMCSLPGRN